MPQHPERLARMRLGPADAAEAENNDAERLTFLLSGAHVALFEYGASFAVHDAAETPVRVRLVEHLGAIAPLLRLAAPAVRTRAVEVRPHCASGHAVAYSAHTVKRGVNKDPPGLAPPSKFLLEGVFKRPVLGRASGAGCDLGYLCVRDSSAAVVVALGCCAARNLLRVRRHLEASLGRRCGRSALGGLLGGEEMEVLSLSLWAGHAT